MPRFTGAGGFLRAKMAINRHILNIKRTMYEDAATKAILVIKQSIIVLQCNLKNDVDLCIKEIEKDFGKMLELAIATPRPESGPAKVKLQTETLRKIEEFDTVLSQVVVKYGEHPGCENAPNFGNGEDETLDGVATTNSFNDGEQIHRDGTGKAVDTIRLQTFSDEEDSDDDDNDQA